MTYLNSRPQNPSLFTYSTALTNDAYFAALAPAYRSVMVVVWSLMMRLVKAIEDSLHNKPGEISGKSKTLLFALFLVLMVLPGTVREKMEFINRIFDSIIEKRQAQMQKLYAAYLVWRQRKCWMWGGGFMSFALAQMTDLFSGTGDTISFDALIPD